MKQQIKEDELIQKQELEAKKNVINEAEERARHLRDDEVDDSEVVDQISDSFPKVKTRKEKLQKRLEILLFRVSSIYSVNVNLNLLRRLKT